MANVPVYPIFLNLKGEPALVVGGGAVGWRKATGLVACGAKVTVVSKAFVDSFKQARRITCVGGGYSAAHMTREKWRLVFAATDVREVNAQVQKDAAAAGILCCRCDMPEKGDFSGGAVLRLGEAGGVTIATSTRGASPVLGGRICREAAAGVEPALVVWAELLEGWRKRVKAKVREAAARRTLLQKIAGEEMEELLRRGGAEVAEGKFGMWLAEAAGRGGKEVAAEVAAVNSPKARRRRARKAREGVVRHAR